MSVHAGTFSNLSCVANVLDNGPVADHRRRARHLPALLNGLYRWLAPQVAMRRVSLVLVAAIIVVDLTLPWLRWGFVAQALIDEPCHQATGLICLGAITRFRGRPPSPGFGWAMIICSNAIDLDHLPRQFGYSMLTAGTPRPYTHALWLVVLLVLAALVVCHRSRLTGAAAIVLGAAFGVSDHFLRDIATAQISLWWPVTSAPVQVPYGWYAGAIVVIAIAPVRAPRRSGRPGDGVGGGPVGVGDPQRGELRGRLLLQGRVVMRGRRGDDLLDLAGGGRGNGRG